MHIDLCFTENVFIYKDRCEKEVNLAIESMYAWLEQKA